MMQPEPGSDKEWINADLMRRARSGGMPASAEIKAAKRPLDRLTLLRNHLLFRDLPPASIERIGS
jgi:hypothetical protein